MSEYYADYRWRSGIPYGITKQKNPLGRCYKIPMDPYRKRISIELYQDNIFQKTIYDSALLDFRLLKASAEQNAWQKTVISTSSDTIISLIRNQDDRLICIETCTFTDNYCRECRIDSPQHIPLSTHRMFYQALGDEHNGVILYDMNGHPVMAKKYAIDADTGEFSDLLEEQWEVICMKDNTTQNLSG